LFALAVSECFEIQNFITGTITTVVFASVTTGESVDDRQADRSLTGMLKLFQGRPIVWQTAVLAWLENDCAGFASAPRGLESVLLMAMLGLHEFPISLDALIPLLLIHD
jgi:hypothetical protein